MSRISYCSLEEAWGNSFKDNLKHNQNKDQELDQNNSQKNINNNKIYDRNKYNKLIEDSIDDRKNVINNMNNIERNMQNNNYETSLVKYDNYRFNPMNKVSGITPDREPVYTPYKENLEKKHLQDKLTYLENEFNKYKILVDNSNDNYNNYNDYNNNSNIEHYSNVNSFNNINNKDTDMIDLIVLIIIGLLMIFILNSIFNIGKAIGARKH